MNGNAEAATVSRSPEAAADRCANLRGGGGIFVARSDSAYMASQRGKSGPIGLALVTQLSLRECQRCCSGSPAGSSPSRQLAGAHAAATAAQADAAQLRQQLQAAATQGVAASRRAEAAEAEAGRLACQLAQARKAAAAAVAAAQGVATAAERRSRVLAAALVAAEDLRRAADVGRGLAERASAAAERRVCQLQDQHERQRGVIATLAASRGAAFEERRALGFRAGLVSASPPAHCQAAVPKRCSAYVSQPSAAAPPAVLLITLITNSPLRPRRFSLRLEAQKVCRELAQAQRSAHHLDQALQQQRTAAAAAVAAAREEGEAAAAAHWRARVTTLRHQVGGCCGVQCREQEGMDGGARVVSSPQPAGALHSVPAPSRPLFPATPAHPPSHATPSSLMALPVHRVQLADASSPTPLHPHLSTMHRLPTTLPHHRTIPPSQLADTRRRLQTSQEAEAEARALLEAAHTALSADHAVLQEASDELAAELAVLRTQRPPAAAAAAKLTLQRAASGGSAGSASVCLPGGGGSAGSSSPSSPATPASPNFAACLLAASCKD